MTKRALITGVTGQDGAYLSQLLLNQCYEVFGLLRRSASAEVVDGRLRWLGIARQVRMIDGDLLDLSSALRALREVKAGRDIQSRRPELCEDVVGPAAADRPGHCARHRRNVGGGAARGAGGALLPSQLLGNVRPDPGARAERDHAVLPTQPLRGRQAVWPLDDGELPRKFWAARQLGHPVQP